MTVSHSPQVGQYPAVVELETEASSLEEAIEEVISSVLSMHKEEKQKEEERKTVQEVDKVEAEEEEQKRKEAPVKAFYAQVAEVVTACFLVVRANGKVKIIESL